MKNALVILAEGFEELEAVTIMDLLVRANIEVTSVGLNPGPITASRQTVILPSAHIDDIDPGAFDIVILPGGLPGADYLAGDPRVIRLVQQQVKENKFVAAICAAPRVLVKAGVCHDKTICCYPGSLDHLDTSHIEITSNAVCADLPIITSRGPGTAMDFALHLIELLEGEEKRQNVEDALVRNYDDVSP